MVLTLFFINSSNIAFIILTNPDVVSAVLFSIMIKPSGMTAMLPANAASRVLEEHDEFLFST